MPNGARGSDAREGVPVTSHDAHFNRHYSPAELAGFRDFANVMRDAIGEKGSVVELEPREAARRGCFGTIRSLHRRGRLRIHLDLFDGAAECGHLELLKWLHTTRGGVINREASTWAR